MVLIILRVCVRAYYMYGTTAKFKSANIFISAARDQTAKFKDRQYFRLYSIVNGGPLVCTLYGLLGAPSVATCVYTVYTCKLVPSV